MLLVTRLCKSTPQGSATIKVHVGDPCVPSNIRRVGEPGSSPELLALLAKQEDEEQMIQAVPAQSKQGMLPDECRAVDNNEPKGQNEIAATTSAVDDDRTTPVTEAASIPASELVHQNSQGHAERGIKRRGGARVAERPWRQVNK